jgi:hypothetical protein
MTLSMHDEASCFAESYGKDGQRGNKGDNKHNNSGDVISWQ